MPVASRELNLWSLVMSVTHPHGLSCSVNRGVVLTTWLLSALGLATLIYLNLSQPHRDGTGKTILYGFCLFACSLFSYLYNARLFPRALALLRKLDHAAIFLLIAGTYTPFLSLNIHGLFDVPLLYWIWGCALAGMALRLKLGARHDRIFVGFYIMLGWLFVMALPDIMRDTTHFSLLFLGMGAVFYSVGALIFARDIGKWTDPVWHTFVLVAAALHFVAVYSLVA
jgi:hemolysin III